MADILSSEQGIRSRPVFLHEYLKFHQFHKFQKSVVGVYSKGQEHYQRDRFGKSSLSSNWYLDRRLTLKTGCIFIDSGSRNR